MRAINDRNTQPNENECGYCNASARDKRNLILGRAFLAVLIVAFLTLLTIFIWQKITEGDINEMTPAEMMEIVNAEDDFDKPYASSYFAEWKFLRINKYKLQSVETVFRDYYVKGSTLPNGYDMAKETLSLFLESFYSRVDLNNEQAVTDAIITCYVEVVGDPYAVYRTPDEYEDYSNEMSGTFIGIGVTVEYDKLENVIRITEVIEDSSAMDSGISVGDCIVAVDGKTLSELGYNGLVDLIKGQFGTKVNITVMRSDESITFEVERRQFTEKTVKYSILEGGIGYVRITAFKRNTPEQFRDAIDELEDARVRGIIYDVRGNLGGYVDSVAEILSYIVPDGTTITSYSNKYSSVKAEGEHTFLIPTVVLCNGRTASGGELFASALRDYNTMGLLEARLVGEKTYGKGVMQDSLPYTDGSVLTLTVAYYYPPLGEDYCYDGIGITPDVTVSLSAEADTQLDAALIEMNEILK